jgi:general secretion pathway protein A
MYTDFYGMSELPFDLSPNPKYLLMTPRHREALANLQYGISSRKSITLLLGEAGTGKTTLIRAALASDVCRGARVLHLNNPSLTRDEFVEFLGRGFKLGGDALDSKTTMLHRLEEALIERRAAGETIALVIDEAQALPYELLEEIRLLANIETATEKLLPVVLAGQPELADRLNEPSLRQLKQRVALRCTLGLLDGVECAAYVAGRIKVAGGDCSQVFTREAVALVHEHSAGVPRTINVICDNALVSGYATETRPVTAAIVRDVCHEFDLANAATRAERAEMAERTPPTPGRDVVPHPVKATDSSDRLFSTINRKRRFSFF